MSRPVIWLDAIPERHAAQLRRLADGLVVAVAVSLPWSTSATSILVVLWLLAILPTLEIAALKRTLLTPAGGLPVLLLLLAALGMVWADVAWAERFDGLGAFVKLAVIPLLIVQFRRSDWGPWVLAGFLISSGLLLALSWAFVLKGPLDPSFLWTEKQHGIPVKDYISQSAVFTICAFALIELAFDGWKDRRGLQALGYALLALLFLLNIFYVATSRTTLIVVPVLLVLFGFVRLGWRQLLGLILISAACAAIVWGSSPYLRYRVTHLLEEVQDYRDGSTEASAGSRISFWVMSLRGMRESPLVGHGTGSIAETFRRQGSDTALNPHNQIFAVGIQLGLIGVVILIAMWIVHWRLFLSSSPVSWFGLVVVTQNVIGSLFNSHLSDFTHGWIYAFGVGVIAGVVTRSAPTNAPALLPEAIVAR
jgi:O-antigen ligase